MDALARRDAAAHADRVAQTAESAPVIEAYNEGNTVRAVPAEQPTPAKTSVVKVAAGTTVYSVICWIFDFPIYTLAIWYGGPLLGGLFMACASIVLDLGTLKAYDSTQEDWLAIEYIKSIKTYRGTGRTKRALAWVLNTTPLPLQIVLLSLKFGPFIVAVFSRPGAYRFDPFSRRDWGVFWASYLIGQIYWILVISAGVEAGRALL
jgi:hypothetical protein